MRRNNLQPRKDIPIYSVWIKNAAVVELILKADKIYIDAELKGACVCSVFISDKPHDEERKSVQVLEIEASEEYDIVRAWVSQPEVCMLGALLTFKGYEVLIDMDVFHSLRPSHYTSFSDALSEKIEHNRRPDPLRGAGSFFNDPIKVIRKKPLHEMMKKFDPKSLDS